MVTELTAEFLQYNEDAATRCGVVARVHPQDMIYQFVVENQVFPDIPSAVNYYFDDGVRSALKVRRHLDRFLPGNLQARVLEFASGYGAVTRHAKGSLAPHVLTSSDIHPEAVNFLREFVGVETLQSTHSPENFPPGQKFDMIFVLSFFSHMPRQTWQPWLARLYEALTPGGILLFTTHGELSMKYFPQCVLNNGFWFQAQSEQHDLDQNEYGMTVTTKQFVDQQIELVGATHLLYEQGGWWDHQDLYILRRTET